MSGPGLFTTEFVEEVRSVSDIVAVVSEYVRLKKVGQNHVGLCPFHNEDTPSFSVSHERQMFYCFGCNTGGDVFEFIKKKEAVDFKEAVRLLAERANLHIPASNPANERREEERLALYHAGDIAKRYFQFCLHQLSGKQAYDYLVQRGIDQAIIEKFGLGYAPDEWEGLLVYLRRHGVSQEIAVKAGFVIPRPRGSGAYDRFRGRLMFPIHDVRGRVVGFGGRILGPGQPKYLNSPETSVYRKARLLYALDIAREGIRRENKALLVEGYLDVLTCYQFGFDYAVASLGTALTSDQIELLKRYTTNIKIAYDADTAGQQATERALRLFANTKSQVHVLPLPSGSDPDDVLRQAGADAFKALEEKAVPPLVYHFRQLTKKHAGGTLEDRLAIARAMVAHLIGIENLVEREEYTKKIVGELEIDHESLRAEMRRQMRLKRSSNNSLPRTGISKDQPPLLPGSREMEMNVFASLAQLFLVFPQVRPAIQAQVRTEQLGQLPEAMVLKAMVDLYKENSADFSLSKLKLMLSDEQSQTILAKLAVGPAPDANVDKLALDYLRFLQLIWVQRDIQAIKREINSPPTAGKNKDSANLIRRLAELHRQKDLLKQPSQNKEYVDGWKEGGMRHAEK